jgi:hypothetical protein
MKIVTDLEIVKAELVDRDLWDTIQKRQESNVTVGRPDSLEVFYHQKAGDGLPEMAGWATYDSKDDYVKGYAQISTNLGKRSSQEVTERYVAEHLRQTTTKPWEDARDTFLRQMEEIEKAAKDKKPD